MTSSILEAQQVSLFRRERWLFKNLIFSVRAGELIQIVGQNGVGKTSLLRLLSALLPCDQGSILWNGKSIEENFDYISSIFYLGHKLGIKSQLTVMENIRGDFRYSFEEDSVRENLNMWGLLSYQDVLGYQLSEGQRKKIALIKLFLSQSKIWILDEPLAALDQVSQALFHDKLLMHLQQGGLAVISTHQPLLFFLEDILFSKLLLGEGE